MENLILQKRKAERQKVVLTLGAVLFAVFCAIAALVDFTRHRNYKIGQTVASPSISATNASYKVEKKKNITFWGDASDVKKEISAKHKERKAYIDRFLLVAKQEQVKFGIPASITLAQGILEGRNGTSRLAVNNNNHFGIKCFSIECKKGHCSNFDDDSHKDFFKKYESPWKSFRDHSILLSSNHYKSLHKYGNDYEKWAYGLKSLGYATDENYAELLIRIIQEHKLDEL